jgi:hypothetical protein
MTPKHQKTLIDLVKSIGRLPSKGTIKSKYPAIYNEIELSWPAHLTSKSFAEKVYHYIFPRETVCSLGKHKSFQSFKNGYAFCDKHCVCASAKKKATMMERYGVEHAHQSGKIRKKFKNTITKKYGSDSLYNAFKSERENTNLKKYNARTPLESPEIRKKTQESFKKIHGFENSFERINSDITGIYQKKRNITREKNNPHLYDYDKIYNTLTNNSYKKSSEILNLYPTHIKNIALRKKWDWLLPRKSSYERLIEDFLISFNIKHIKNSRSVITPFELDFYIPDYNIAIEVNGLKWHSEWFGKKDKLYHLNKTKMCREKNIHLIHIFEDEINNLPDTVFSILKTFLNIPKKTIYGRNCELIQLTTSDAKDFCNNYHLQGYASSSFRYGLKFDNHLISVMTFKKQTRDEYELSRYCIHPEISVIGGAQRMFNQFIKNNIAAKIYTYSDNRYFTGNLYKKLGFTLSHVTQPNYWYFKEYNKRYHRLGFTKQKLIKQGFDETQTETQIMRESNFDRIWDCGNTKWIFKNNPNNNILA